MKIFMLILTILSANISLSQKSINSTNEAPLINITNWIHNIPENKELKNKYIVLEFWATWCAPCVQAIPHMNDLQKDIYRNDLLYISITDEKREKVEQFIKLIPINSIVVSDTTRKSIENFKKSLNINVIPFTVLIDNKGIIKWHGNPKYLTKKILEQFLTNQIAETESDYGEIKDYNNFNKTFDPDSESGFKKYLNIVTDETIKNYFELRETKNKSSVIEKKINKKMFFLESINLTNILNYLIGYNKQELDVDIKLDSINYSLIYKNSYANENSLKHLEIEILNALSIKKTYHKKMIDVYLLELLDKKKLDNSVDKEKSITSANNNVLYSKYTIKELVKELNKYNTKYFDFKNSDEKFYNFVIDKSSTESIIDSLKKSGFNIIFKKEEIKINRFTQL